VKEGVQLTMDDAGPGIYHYKIKMIDDGIQGRWSREGQNCYIERK